MGRRTIIFSFQLIWNRVDILFDGHKFAFQKGNPLFCVLFNSWFNWQIIISIKKKRPNSLPNGRVSGALLWQLYGRRNNQNLVGTSLDFGGKGITFITLLGARFLFLHATQAWVLYQLCFMIHMHTVLSNIKALENYIRDAGTDLKGFDIVK